MNVEKFDWTEELHQTMVKSLVTSFGLDFLLLNDRKGGDVDTIHNVRNGIYATEAERQRYEGRGDYDSHHYHSHENYIATNRKGKRAHQAGTLTDAYTGEVLMNPLMILVKIIKLRWIHILSYDQMVSRKINNQTTRCANSIFYTTLFTNSAPNYT